MTRAGTTAGEHQQSSADGGGQAIFEEHEGRLLLLSHARVTRVSGARHSAASTSHETRQTMTRWL